MEDQYGTVNEIKIYWNSFTKTRNKKASKYHISLKLSCFCNCIHLNITDIGGSDKYIKIPIMYTNEKECFSHIVREAIIKSGGKWPLYVIDKAIDLCINIPLWCDYIELKD